MACAPSSGRRASRSSRAASTSLIWSMTKRSRAMSRPSSAIVFGGSGIPSGVRSVPSRSDALRSVGLKPRMPRRARVPFIRFTRRVRSPIRLSCSRFGRLASSSSTVGIAAIVQ